VPSRWICREAPNLISCYCFAISRRMDKIVTEITIEDFFIYYPGQTVKVLRHLLFNQSNSLFASKLIFRPARNIR